MFVRRADYREAGQSLERREDFKPDPITNHMKLTYDPSAVSLLDIAAAVQKTGAKAVLVVSK